jgi:hypothetical protein
MSFTGISGTVQGQAVFNRGQYVLRFADARQVGDTARLSALKETEHLGAHIRR